MRSNQSAKLLLLKLRQPLINFFEKKRWIFGTYKLSNLQRSIITPINKILLRI